MKRFALLLLLTSCGPSSREEVSPKGKSPHPLPPQLISSDHPESVAAAAALKEYYRLIGRGALREAWWMRATDPGRRGISYEAFRDNYARYARYDAQVAYLSPPVSGSGYSFVHLQVQLTGEMKTGEPFGTVGSITMRRKLAGRAADLQWKVTN